MTANANPALRPGTQPRAWVPGAGAVRGAGTAVQLASEFHSF